MHRLIRPRFHGHAAGSRRFGAAGRECGAGRAGRRADREDRWMDIVTDEDRRALLENGRVNAARVAMDGDTVDFAPVVKLFCPWGAGT